MTLVINKNQKGFTLIELLVSTAIFMMVMLAAVGALLITSNAAKKAKSVRYAMDNVNYAMDSISRNLRLGSDLYCYSVGGFSTASTTNDCVGGSAIAYMPYNGSSQNNGYQLYKNTTTGITSIQMCDANNGGCSDMTAPDIDITDMRFTVRGSSKTDGIQPSTIIIIKGKVDIGGKVTTFALQTLASQRSTE